MGVLIIIILDTRDYITSDKDMKARAYCIPLAYLNRHYVDLPSNKKIIVIAYHLQNKFKKEGYSYGIQCTNEK